MLCGPGLPSPKRLPGPYADSGPPRAVQRHWPAGAPLPAAERLTSVPGPTGGAVPQAHVPLLTTGGSRSPTPTFSLTCPGLGRWPAPGSDSSSSTQAYGRSAAEKQTQKDSVLLPEWWWQDGKFGLTDTAWSRAWEKHFRSELKAACSSSPLNSAQVRLLIGFL